MPSKVRALILCAALACVTSQAGIIRGGASSGPLSVASGGTGLASGTSGGIPAYTASGTITSSGVLTANQLVIGGGAGAVPSVLAAGAQGHILTMGASSPAYAAPVYYDSAPWYIKAKITGANPDLTASDVSSYTEIADAGLTMTPSAGSAAAGIMCSSTNAATAPSTSPTTCAAGSESLGLNFTTPAGGTGLYSVCVQFSHVTADGLNTETASVFQIIRTPTNAQTLTEEAGPKAASSFKGVATGNAATHPIALCGLFALSAATTYGFRLMYEQDNTGTPDSNVIAADASAALGQRDVFVTVTRQ